MHRYRLRRHGDPLIVHQRGWKLGTERASTLHAMVKPSVKDLHWAAGFLEGEGCFNRLRKCARVTVNQVNREPIDRLLTLFGGAAKYYLKRKGAIHKTQPSPIWDWYVSGSRARGVMMTFYPLMTAKRKAQIRQALV